MVDGFGGLDVSRADGGSGVGGPFRKVSDTSETLTDVNLRLMRVKGDPDWCGIRVDTGGEGAWNL